MTFPLDSKFSRNLLWMPPDLVGKISNSKLTVIGCGGNGVVFTIYAVHMGFSELALCDGDLLEATNFNRYIVASSQDVGKPKVDILGGYILSRFPQSNVSCIAESFPNPRVVDHIEKSAVVVGCVDNVQARIELDILCRRFGKTLIDLGSGFIKDDSSTGAQQIIGAGGQVLVSRPSGACLRCLGFDLETASNTYFLPERLEPEPSSLLLNGIVGALAAECLLMEITNRLNPANRISYNRGSLSTSMESLEGGWDCRICGHNSADFISSAGCGKALREILEREGVHCKT